MKAILFDMDGTLAETEDLKFRAYQNIFQSRYQVELPLNDTWRGRPERLNARCFLDMFGLAGDIQELITASRTLSSLQVETLQNCQEVLGDCELAKDGRLLR